MTPEAFLGEERSLLRLIDAELQYVKKAHIAGCFLARRFGSNHETETESTGVLNTGENLEASRSKVESLIWPTRLRV